MIDAHNHLQDPRFLGRQEELIAVMKDKGISACVVNGTSEDDWEDVARLTDRFPDFIRPAFGLHPWRVSARSEHWLDQLTHCLEQYPHSSLGECGLDRWMKSPDLEAQHQVFREQLALAQRLDRPVTIHCLKAWGPLLSELKDHASLPRFLLHSFAGSLEIARECNKLGAYFSFSGYFLHARKENVRKVFSQLPPDQILVETDAPDMSPPETQYPLGELNHPANLGMISKALAQICDLAPTQFTINTRRFLGEEIGS